MKQPQANSSRAQDYLMQIVTAGYGFDVPDIQNALMKTNYKSVEAAVEYLFANQAGGSGGSGGSASSSSQSKSDTKPKQDSVSEKDIQELKDRIKKLELEGNFKLDVTHDIMSNAIKQNPNRPEDAVNYIMDKYHHLIQSNDNINTVNSKQDAQALKQKLIDDALKKKEEQVMI